MNKTKPFVLHKAVKFFICSLLCAAKKNREQIEKFQFLLNVPRSTTIDVEMDSQQLNRVRPIL